MALNKMRFTLWLFIMLMVCPLLRGQIAYRDVEARGNGTTLNSAINDALGEAIGQVNGKSIDTQTQLNSVEVVEANQDSSSYFASEAFQQSVQTATRGAVSSYEILSQDNVDGLWQVKVRAKVAEYKRSKSATRKRIAVMPLRLTDGEFKINESIIDKEQGARLMGQALVSQIVQSRKFTVLDREFIAETVGEKSMILEGDVPLEEMAKLGQELFADYILVGIFEGMQFATTTRKLMTSDREVSVGQGEVVFSYRIIDVPTRQIKFADLARIPITESDIQSSSGALLSGQRELQSALTEIAAERIAKKVLDAIYPMLVVSVRGDRVTLNQGGDMLKVGDKYDVFQYGEKMIDPYTNESLGREELFLTEIEITRVNPKSAQAKVLDTDANLSEYYRPKGLVCRASLERTNNASEELQKIQKRQEERKKNRDDDW